MFLLLMWLMYVNYAVGPASEVVILLAVVAAVVIRQRRLRKRYWELPVPAIFFSVFIVYISLLLIKTPLPQYSLDKVVQSVSILLIYLFIDSMITRKEKARLWENVFIAVVLGLATIEFLFFFLWYARWIEISGSLYAMPPIGYRLEGIILSSANFATGSLNLILPLVVIRFIRGKNRAKLPPAICLVLIGVIEYYASSRAGWVAAFVAIAVTLFLTYFPAVKRSWENKKQLLRSISGKAAMAGGAGLAIILFVASLFIMQSRNTAGHSGVLSGRDVIWSNAWRIWTSNFWTGGGSGTFPLHYAQIVGPGEWLPGHAHNIWLHLGAETGMIGIIFWLAAIVWFVIAGIRAWERLSKSAESRTQFAAYAGIAVGVMLQQQANYFFTTPLYVIFASLLVALFAKRIDLPRLLVSNLAVYPILVTFLVIYVGGTIYAFTGGGNLGDAMVAYGEGDFEKATSLICRSANEAPQFTVYSFQCGVLNADLFQSNGDTTYIQQAIEKTRDVLKRDPFWPVHWANLAVLEWISGDRLAAISDVKRAAEGAPNNALIALNYGWMAEELGREEEAQTAYQGAIMADPWLLESPFFRATPLRSELLKRDYVFSVGADIVRNLSVYQAIKSGDLVVARQVIGDEFLSKQRSPETLALLGIIEQKVGRGGLAFLHAQTAVFLAEMRPQEEHNPRIYIWASQISIAQGKPQDAAAYIEEAFSIWINKRQYDSALYYYHVYHRPLQLHTFVLGFKRADITEEMVSAFQWLVEYYRNEGFTAEAAQMNSFLAAEVIEF